VKKGPLSILVYNALKIASFADLRGIAFVLPHPAGGAGLNTRCFSATCYGLSRRSAIDGQWSCGLLLEFGHHFFNIRNMRDLIDLDPGDFALFVHDDIDPA
jgi:hypothetical protein